MVRRRWITTTSTAEVRRLFVDTSAWLTLANRTDRLHQDAVQFHRSLSAISVRIVTWGLSAISVRIVTWGIISETYTWLRYHVGFAQAERWLRETVQLQSRGSLEVVYPTAAMEREIHHILRRFQDHDLSYIDALSIHIATSNRDIDAIFAFDRHLALAGIPILPGPLSAKTR